MTSTLVCFIISLFVFMLKMMNPGLLFYTVLIIIGGAAITVMAATLAYLVDKARKMKDESDLTV